MSRIDPKDLYAMVASSTVVLFLYFFLKPEVDVTSTLLILGLWGASMTLDLSITLANKSYIIPHERSVILSYAYARFSRPVAILFVISVEFSCVVFLPGILMQFQGWEAAICAVGYFFSILHAYASWKNENFVKNKLW